MKTKQIGLERKWAQEVFKVSFSPMLVKYKMLPLTLCLLDDFACFFGCVQICFNIKFYEKFFQEYNQKAKQLDPDQARHFVQKTSRQSLKKH